MLISINNIEMYCLETLERLNSQMLQNSAGMAGAIHTVDEPVTGVEEISGSPIDAHAPKRAEVDSEQKLAEEFSPACGKPHALMPVAAGRPVANCSSGGTMGESCK